MFSRFFFLIFSLWANWCIESAQANPKDQRGFCRFTVPDHVQYQPHRTSKKLIFNFLAARLEEQHIHCELPAMVRRSFLVTRAGDTTFGLQIPPSFEFSHYRKDGHIYVEFQKNLNAQTSLEHAAQPRSLETFSGFQIDIAVSASGTGLKFTLEPKGLISAGEKPCLALFEKDGYFWITSRRPLLYDTKSRKFSLPGYGAPEAMDLSPARSQDGFLEAQTLRFAFPKKQRASLSFEDTEGKTGKVSFILDEVPLSTSPFAQPLPQSLLKKIFFSSEKNSSAEELKIQIPGVQAVSVRDPSSLAPLIVFPVVEKRWGINNHLHYADFHLLPSLQGLVFSPLTEHLAVRTGETPRLFLPHTGLHLSKSNDRLNQKRPLEKKLFEFAEWQRTDTPFSQERERLTRIIHSTSGMKNLRAKIDLTRFYLAHRFGAEANGILQNLLNRNTLLKHDQEIKSLLGLVAFFEYDFLNAFQYFSHPLLPAEAQIWKGASLIELGWYEQGLALIEKHTDILKDYPQNILLQISLMAADAAIRSKAPQRAQPFFELLKGMSLTLHQKRYLNSLEKERIFNPLLQEQGLSFQPAGHNSLLGRTLSETVLGELDLQHQSGRLKPREVINKLKDLRELWRGTFLEFSILHKIAKVSQKLNEPLTVMNAYKDALTLFPYLGQKQNLAQEGAVFFSQTLLDNKNLTDRQKVSFFKRYQENFFPTDPAQQTQLSQKMAEHCMKLELFPEAIFFLENAIQNTPTPQLLLLEQLLETYLDNQQPQKALELFDKNYAFSDETDVKRWQNLKIKTLFKGGLIGQAGSLVDEDTLSYDPDLSSKVLWENKNFPKAALALRNLLQASEVIDGDLLLRLAIAFNRTKDEQGLQKLRESYQDILPEGTQKETFLILTQTLQPTPRFDLNKVKKSLLDVVDFRNFLSRSQSMQGP